MFGLRFISVRIWMIHSRGAAYFMFSPAFCAAPWRLRSATIHEQNQNNLAGKCRHNGLSTIAGAVSENVFRPDQRQRHIPKQQGRCDNFLFYLASSMTENHRAAVLDELNFARAGSISGIS